MNYKLKNIGNKLSQMAGTMLLMASSGDRVGAAIQKQWIKDLRSIAEEMENGESSDASSGGGSATGASGKGN